MDCVGDINRDGFSDALDIEPFITAFLDEYDPCADLDASGPPIDELDLALFLEEVLTSECAWLIRSPYLQSPSPTAITIAWRTSVPTTSVVRYGTNPDDLSQSTISTTLRIDHFVRLTGLTPKTKYYYAVETQSMRLAGGDPNHHFTTAPLFGSHTRLLAWVLGDSGSGAAAQYNVRNSMLTFMSSHPLDLFLHMGDVVYNSGTDAEYTTRFFAAYPSILRAVPFWPTLGNHDAASANSTTQTGPYYEAFSLPRLGECGGRPSGTEAYYSFDHGQVHFICLDSHGTSRAPGSTMLTWLQNDLANTTQKWIIAFWHHPPYSKGGHDSDNINDSGGRMRDMRQNVLPILEAGGVDLVLTGHSHSYERSYLINGAYATPTTADGHVLDWRDGKFLGEGPYEKPVDDRSHEGTVYVVCGHGGASVTAVQLHPVMYFAESHHGSCLLSVDGDVLNMVNLRSTGQITDDFAIVKGLRSGDINGDGSVDLFDVDQFVAVMLGSCVNDIRCLSADILPDGRVDALDVQPFIGRLLEQDAFAGEG